MEYSMSCFLLFWFTHRKWLSRAAVNTSHTYKLTKRLCPAGPAQWQIWMGRELFALFNTTTLLLLVLYCKKSTILLQNLEG